MVTNRVREALQHAHVVLRVVVGALLCALGWVIVLFTSAPRTRRSLSAIPDSTPPSALDLDYVKRRPEPSDLPSAWRVSTGSPNEYASSSVPVSLAPYIERMDDPDG